MRLICSLKNIPPVLGESYTVIPFFLRVLRVMPLVISIVSRINIYLCFISNVWSFSLWDTSLSKPSLSFVGRCMEKIP